MCTTVLVWDLDRGSGDADSGHNLPYEIKDRSSYTTKSDLVRFVIQRIALN
jgi:hypothetical protein